VPLRDGGLDRRSGESADLVETAGGRESALAAGVDDGDVGFGTGAELQRGRKGRSAMKEGREEKGDERRGSTGGSRRFE
jgi:hypothetical protein